MESNPAAGSGMGRFTGLYPERGALLRHEHSPFPRAVEFPIRRTEMYDPPARNWQEEIEKIRDRVTISAWSLPGTAVRHETYDRRGNLTSTVYLPISTESAVLARTIRCEAAVVMEPHPEAARRLAGKEAPGRILSWSPAKALPGPA